MVARPDARMNDASPIIETRGLTRQFRSGPKTITVLDDVSLSIARGEFVAIMGPSGCGKSTLLALLAGLDRPSAGGVSIDGEAIEAMSEDRLALLRRRKVGFVFQSFHLLANFTATENVMLPVELLGGPSPRVRAAELLERVGLAGRGHHYPSQLSGGEQQRVALARSFAPDPAVLLADEPTGNLDKRQRPGRARHDARPPPRPRHDARARDARPRAGGPGRPRDPPPRRPPRRPRRRDRPSRRGIGATGQTAGPGAEPLVATTGATNGDAGGAR